MEGCLFELDSLLRDADELEPLPASTVRLAGLVTDEASTLVEICDVIRFDQALTGRLLGAANSAISGPMVRVTTVEQAVMRLGTGRVLALALGGHLRGSLRSGSELYGLEEGQLWLHSVTAAVAIGRVHRHARLELPPESFAAALMHDLGKLVLTRFLSEEATTRVREVQRLRGLSWTEAEQQVLGETHASIGAHVARGWGLSETLVHAIEHHHTPLAAPDAESRQLCSLIRLADAIADGIDAGSRDESEAATFSPSIAGSLSLSRAGFEALSRDVEQRLSRVLEVYDA